MRIRRTYNFKPRVLDWDERFYKVGNEYFVRVTHILDVVAKIGLRYYYGKHGTDKAEELSEKARDRGTRIHDAQEQLFLGKVVNLEEFPDPMEKKMLLGLERWYKKYKPSIIATEHTVVSFKHEIAGTLDLLFLLEINGKTHLMDTKTGKDIYPEAAIQLAAYKAMVMETTNIEVDDTYVLLLTAETKKGYRFKKVYAPFGVFLAVKKVFEYVNGGKEKIKPIRPTEYPKTIQLFKKKKVKKKKKKKKGGAK